MVFFSFENEYDMWEGSDNILPFRSIVMHTITHRLNTCKKCINFKSEEEKQSLNSKKLRICFVDETQQDLKQGVCVLLNSAYFKLLNTDDIVQCERVDCWDDRKYPKDIVVTFQSKVVRDIVYINRDIIEQYVGIKAKIKILEELIPERGLIYSKAVNFYGLQNVSTSNGAVLIHTFDFGIPTVYTMEELTAIMEFDRESVWRKLIGDNLNPVFVDTNRVSTIKTFSFYILTLITRRC